MANRRSSADLRIIFMGTPEFAVASLDAMVNAGMNIVCVITAPDKPAGRGMKMTESAVKQYAVANGLPVLQPEKLKAPEFIQSLRSLNADLQVVVAFRMLPEIVWSMPPLGTINLHGSLLPKYRGAAPINWAVINGESITGVTTFRLQQEIDTGNILMQESFPIGPNDTAGDVHDKMKEIGARLLVRTIDGLADGTISEKPQLPSLSTEGQTLPQAPKLFTETCRINFHLNADRVHNLIRGLSPFPGAFTEWEGKMVKIFRTEKVSIPLGESKSPGSFRTDQKTYLWFYCGTDAVSVLELQLEGKKRMKIEEFLRGYRFNG